MVYYCLINNLTCTLIAYCILVCFLYFLFCFCSFIHFIIIIIFCFFFTVFVFIVLVINEKMLKFQVVLEEDSRLVDCMVVSLYPRYKLACVTFVYGNFMKLVKEAKYLCINIRVFNFCCACYVVVKLLNYKRICCISVQPIHTVTI